MSFLVVLLLLLSWNVLVWAAGGEGWQTQQIRVAGGGRGTKRAMHEKGKSKSGGSSKSKSGGTGKSKSKSDQDGVANNDFPKYIEATAEPIPGQYIITYKKKTDEIMADSEMDDMSEKLCSSKNGKLMSTYHTVLKGFSAKLTKEAAMEISQMDMIEAVTEDGVVRADAVGIWGLDRIDQRDLPLDGTYSPLNMDGSSSNRGQGVTVYIVDSGIQSNHDEWGSRYAGGMNFHSDGRNSEDCEGHGTHVAGTVGGTTYGVANNAKLFAIRVLGCDGSGSFSGIMEGLEWIAKNAAKPAVANLSLGGGFYEEANEAVNNLVDSGVVVTVSAGNSNDDSCGRSPASADKAITVGSTTKTDARSSFSSYGACVDIFAPGSGIISAYKGGATASRTLSGTSMSAPHVAGLAALYLGENPSLLPAEVARKMLQYDATYDSVSGIPEGTANLLAYAGPNECASKLDADECTLPNQCRGICQGNVCSLPPGKFSFAIKIDEYPGDTSWELRQSSTVVESRNAGDYSRDSTLYCEQVDIVPGTSYTFKIMDSYDNGICCSEGHGYYSIYDGNTHLKTGNEFESSETTTFTAIVTTAIVPTETPTRVPTEVPTKAPTQAPTETPTRVPTDVPTKAPTQAPVACSDSPLRLKIFKEGATTPITRSCEWVKRTNTAERCNLTGVSAACPVACGSCDTCADPELRFKFTYNNNTITRSCEFVGRIEDNVSGRCAASQNICRETCGAC